MQASGTALQHGVVYHKHCRASLATSITSFKQLRRELRPRTRGNTKHPRRAHITRFSARASAGTASNYAVDQVVASQIIAGVKVDLTYSYVIETAFQPANNTRQTLCKLDLTGELTSEPMISQAAKLVCYQRYQQWRETRLERLVLWFDVYFPKQLNASKLSEMRREVKQSERGTGRALFSCPAIRLMDHSQLIIMARLLEPERLKLVLDQYASAFGLRKLSEVELLARRTASAKAGTEKPDAAKATAVSHAPAQAGSQQGRAPGVGLARSAISEAEYVEQSQRCEEGRRELMDLLLSWVDDQTKEHESELAMLKSRAQSLQQQPMDSKAKAEVSGRDVNRNSSLQAAIQLKTSQLNVWKKKFPKWSELAEKETEVTSTFRQRDTTTPAGQNLRTCLICTVHGPDLPLMLAQADTKTDFMTGFSSADHSPLLHRVQGRWRPIGEESILTKFAFLAKQHLKLHQVEEFQVTMPKEALPPRLKPLPASPGQPAATAPGQSTNANAFGPKSTEGGDKANKPEASSVSAKAQSLGIVKDSNVGGSSSSNSISSSRSSIESSSSSSSSSRDIDPASGGDGVRVGIKDATVSDSSDVSVRPSEKAVPSSVMGDAQAASPSGEGALSGRSGSPDSTALNGSEPSQQQAQVAVRNTVGKVDDAPAQVQQAEQQRTPTSVNAAADTDEEEEEQAVSGSVRKSGFRFAGTGLQLREVAAALDQYVCAERRAMQWMPAQGPVRLQRLVMSKRTGDWHNLQLSGAFGVKPGVPDNSQGSRSRYISDVHLNALTECLDQYIQQQGQFLTVATLDPVARPKQPSVFVSAAKAAGRLTGFAALAVLFVAPFAAASRSGFFILGNSAQVNPNAAVQLGQQDHSDHQAEAMHRESVQAASQAAADHLPNKDLADDDDMQQLCSKLQDRLKPPPAVAALNSHANLLGQEAVYQVTVDRQGELYACHPVNEAAVAMWSSTPAVAELRSLGYQQQYQAWLESVSARASSETAIPQVGLPESEELIQKQLPEDPLLLKMSVTISSDGDFLARSSGAEDRSAEETESTAVGPESIRAPAFDVSFTVDPWTQTDTERALAGVATHSRPGADATG